MHCRKLEDDSRTSAWLDLELSEREASELERHVSECASCRELASSLRELRLRVVAELEPDPGFLVRFRERRDELSVAPFWTSKQFALRLLPLAATVLVAALWTALLSSAPSRGDAEDEAGESVLELEALGAPTAFAAGGPPEPVLSIALEPFPLDLP